MEKAKAERVAKMELAKQKLDIRASRHSNVVPQRSTGSADGPRYRLRAGQLCLHTRLGMCPADGQLRDSGMTGVNVGVISNAAAPFGDIKQSGIGREGSPEGLLEYPDVKYVMFANPTLALGR